MENTQNSFFLIFIDCIVIPYMGHYYKYRNLRMVEHLLCVFNLYYVFVFAEKNNYVKLINIPVACGLMRVTAQAEQVIIAMSKVCIN